MDSAPVSCITCGFASRRTQHITPAHPSLVYLEISGDERKSGLRFTVRKDNSRLAPAEVITQLCCFVQAFDLDAEATRGEPGPLVSEDIYTMNAKAVLETARSCEEWYPYTSGLDPKEHREVRHMERLEAMRQQFVEDREKARNEADARRELAHFDNEKLIRRLTWVGVGLAAAQVLSGVFSLTADSWFVKLLCRIFGR
jgi:hypothetical protein